MAYKSKFFQEMERQGKIPAASSASENQNHGSNSQYKSKFFQTGNHLKVSLPQEHVTPAPMREATDRTFTGTEIQPKPTQEQLSVQSQLGEAIRTRNSSTPVGTAANMAKISELQVQEAQLKVEQNAKRVQEVQQQEQRISQQLAKLETTRQGLEKLMADYQATGSDVTYQAYMIAYADYNKQMEAYNKEYAAYQKNAKVYDDYNASQLKYEKAYAGYEKNYGKFETEREKYLEEHPEINYMDSSIEEIEQRISDLRMGNRQIGAAWDSGAVSDEDYKAYTEKSYAEIKALSDLSKEKKAIAAQTPDGVWGSSAMGFLDRIGLAWQAGMIDWEMGMAGIDEKVEPIVDKLNYAAGIFWKTLGKVTKAKDIQQMGEDLIAAGKTLTGHEEIVKMMESRDELMAEALYGAGSVDGWIIKQMESIGSMMMDIWMTGGAQQLAGNVMTPGMPKFGMEKKLGGGYALTTTAGAMKPALSTTKTMAIRAAGSGMIEAEEKGYSLSEQILYGIASGSLEYLSETMFGGNPIYDEGSGWLTDAMAKTFKNPKVMKLMYSKGFDILSEGFEEVFVSVAQPIAESAITWEKPQMPTAQEMAESFAGGLFLSVIGQGASVVATEVSGAGHKNRKAYRSVGDIMQTADAVELLIEEGLAADQRTDAYDLATKLQKKLADGKKLTASEVGKLVYANQDAIDRGLLVDADMEDNAAAPEGALHDAEDGFYAIQTVETENGKTGYQIVQVHEDGSVQPVGEREDDLLTAKLMAEQKGFEIRDIGTAENLQQKAEAMEQEAVLNELAQTEQIEEEALQQEMQPVETAQPAAEVNEPTTGLTWAGDETVQAAPMTAIENEETGLQFAGNQKEAIINEQTEQTEQTDRDDRSTAGNADYAPVQTGTAGGDGSRGNTARVTQTRTHERGAAASYYRSAVEDLGVKRVDIREVIPIGVEGNEVHVVPESAYDDEAKRAKEAAADKGLDLVLVVGNIPIMVENKERSVIGMIDFENGKIYVRADSSKQTVMETVIHELFHDAADRDATLVPRLIDFVKENYTYEEYSKIVDRYYRDYRDMYPHLEGEALKEAVWEELLADAYAEYNRYGKETLPGLSEEVQKLTWAGEEKTTGQRDGQRYLISDTFAQDVDFWLKETKEADRMVSPGYFRIGTTSEPLKSIGVRDGNIYWRKSKIGYILSDHPEISDGTIMTVPDILEQPVLIMKSLTRDDSIVLFGNLYAENGDRVMVALELTPRAGGDMEAEFSLITSTYPRSKKSVQNLIQNSEILYIDENKERADTWLMQLGVQFPSRQPAYGSIGSIAYEKDGVKITGKTLQELGGVISKKTEEAGANRKFSADTEYMDAVNQGDMETAKQMVDEAAKNNGYTKKRFHETKKENIIHVFDLSLNTNASGDYGTPFGIFTKSHDRTVGLGGKQMELFVKADNTFHVKDRTEIPQKLPSEYSDLIDKMKRMDEKYDPLYEEQSDAVMDLFEEWLDENDPDNEIREAWDVSKTLEEQFGDRIPEKILAMEREQERIMDEWKNAESKAILEAKTWLTKWLRDNDYDSMELEFDNGAGNRVTDALIVLDENQVKSADPVTYDDNGNVIPLSQRFDEKKTDIRFSTASEETEKRTAETMRDEVLESMPSDFSPTPHSVPRKSKEESKFAEKLTDEERAVVEQAMEKREKTEKKSIFDMTIEEMLIPKEGFTSTPAIDKLGVKVAGSVARYRSTEDLKAYVRAATLADKYLRNAVERLKPTDKEIEVAKQLVDGPLDTLDLNPETIDIQKVTEIADFYAAKKSYWEDSLSQRKDEIRVMLQRIAQELFADSDKYAPNLKKLPILTKIVMNYKEAERLMRKIFGDEQGQKIYDTVFYPVWINSVEAKRWQGGMLEKVQKFTDKDGKERALTLKEREFAQRIMEGQAVIEELQKLREGTRSKIAKAARALNEGKNLSEVSTEFGLDQGYQQGLAQQYADYLSMVEITENMDTTIMENAIKVYRQLYNDLYDAINDFLVSHGKPPIGFIKNYAPHFQKHEVQNALLNALSSMGLSQANVSQLPTDIAGRTADYKPIQRWNPHFQQRKGHKTDYDIQVGFERYIDYAAEVFFHTDDIMRVREIVNYYRSQYAGEAISEAIQNAQIDRYKDTNWKIEFLKKQGAIDPLKRTDDMSPKEVNEKYEEYISELYKQAEPKNLTKYSNFVTWLDDYANTLAGKQSWMDRGFEAFAGRDALRWSQQVVNAFAKANVAGNLSTVFNQLAQVPILQRDLGIYYELALMDIVTKKTRQEGFSKLSDLLTDRKGIEGLAEMPTGGLLKWLFKPAELTDTLVATIAVRGKYRQLLAQNKGMTPEQALKEADNYGRRVMGSRAKGAKPLAFNNKNFLAAQFNMYQLEALNTLEYMRAEWPRQFRETAKKRGIPYAVGREAVKALLFMLSTFIINRLTEDNYGGTPAPLDILGWVLTFVSGAYDEDEEKFMQTLLDNILEKSSGERPFGTEPLETPEEGVSGLDWAGAYEDLKYNLLDEIPVVRNITQTLGMGDQSGAMAGVGEVFRSLKAGFTTLKDQLLRGEDETGLDWAGASWKALSEFGSGASIFMPAGRQLKKTARGVTALIRGGMYGGYGENKRLQYPVEATAGNIVRGVMFGPSGFRETDEYYLDGKALSASQTQKAEALEENGVDIQQTYDLYQEYSDINENEDKELLTSIEAKAEKRNAIAEMDLNDWQKMEVYLQTLYTGNDKGREKARKKYEDLIGENVTWQQLTDLDNDYAALNEDADGDGEADMDSLERGIAKRNTIAMMDLTDWQKLEVYDRYHLDRSADNYEETRKEFEAMLNAGLSWEEITAAHNTYARLNADDELTANQKATEYARWADEQGWNETQKTAIKERYMFWQMIPAEATKYEKFTEQGMSGSEAQRLIELQEKINDMGLTADKDADGKTIAGSKKKKVIKAIGQMNISDDMKDALYFAYGYAESKLDETPWH